MFRPDSNRDRTDYSGILMPPDGYRLDRAVGTTYSLDLEALTAVAICLGLSEETDSKLMQNPIGMLNALQKVSDKIVLFCEAGQIKVPTKPTALSILLEKMVVEVALPKDRQLGRYPSFHPKTWVLAYVNAEGDKKYRFVVMSRNLTFDRSWDISFAMDSSKNVRQKKKTQPICDFLDYLVMNVHNTSNNAGKKRNLIRGLCADIKDVSFSLESKIFGENFEVLPVGIGKNAYHMQEDILFCKERGNANSTFNELVVMSPFLSESVIADFNLTDRALSDCKRTLVTRRSELGKLKASDVDNFTIYALKDGEAGYVAAEMLQDNLHSVRVALCRCQNDRIGNKGFFRVAGFVTIRPIHQHFPPDIFLAAQKSLSACTVSCFSTYRTAPQSRCRSFPRNSTGVRLCAFLPAKYGLLQEAASA